MHRPPPVVPEIPFTLKQAKSHGLTRRQIRSLLRSGEIRRVVTNVYASSAIPDTLDTRASAIALILPSHCVVTDRTAAWLHGVDVLRFRELEVLPPVDVFALRGYARRQRAGLMGGERDLAAGDVMSLAPGFNVTTPLRTALDLGCRLSRRDALAAMDQFMRLHGITTGELFAALPRYRGRRGVVQLRQVVVQADPQSESVGESWTRMAMIDAGLPTPELQFSIVVDGREWYRLDLAYPKHRVCVEYDGREFHSTPEQVAADTARRRWLRDHGWTVIVVTADDLDADSVARWTGQVKDALAAA